MTEERLYPIGIQTFSEVINRRCVYVDKTDLMWRLQDRYKYIFLARPRRFGKSQEGFYEYTLYLIFSMLNVYVRTQVKVRGGRVDMVVQMPQTTYVFEFKTEGTAQQALQQIDDKSYALPYQTEGRRVVKVGVSFDANTRTPKEWVIDNDSNQ